MNKNKLYDQIIKKIPEEKIGTINISELKNKYNSDINHYWNNRTNEPYKNIIKNDDYKKKITNTSDLVVHKVTHIDKLGVENDFKKLQNEIDKQDNDLKNLYSNTKKQEHINVFEYNHKYKFRQLPSMTQNTSEDIKQNGMQYYKSEQINIENEKKKASELLESINYLNTNFEIKNNNINEIKNNNINEIKNNNINEIKKGVKIVH